MLTYSFSKIGSESLYMYLYKCIREDILTGKIMPGTKLPSKRSFAENLGVSVITVENAYAQLVSEGYVYALPKKGFFAANLEKSTAPQKKESAPQAQLQQPQKEKPANGAPRGKNGRGEKAAGRDGNEQQASDQPVHPPGRAADVPAIHGHDGAGAGQRMEHDAGAHPRASDGSVYVF